MCMRKFQSFAFAGAIALAGVAGLTACSSDDAAEAPLNPTFDGESVKTAFAINVAAPSKGGTRMTDENTQNKNNYLGMDNVRLLTLSSAPSDDKSLLSALALSTPSISTSKSSHIYSDVNIPVTTSNFLFYSTRANLGETVDDKAATGAIVSNLFASKDLKVANTSNISFSSEPIINSTNTISTEQNTFATYLNKVLQTADDNGNTWSNAADGSTLKQAYTNFTKTYTYAQRAGSADAVRLQMQALYNVAKPIADNTTATDKELAKKLCENILNKNGGSATAIEFTETSGKLAYATSVGTKLSNFPGQKGLPEGAALLTYNGTSFAYVTETSSPIIGQGDNKVNAYNITYPLPIVYFDNTPAKATNVEIADNDWKTSTSNWDADATWNGWNDEVTATTRSIALKNNINYGVAGLKTIVKCDAAALEDNRDANLSGQGNQSINVPTGGFEVTGILIGGQPNSVNWQFVNTSTATRDYVVYDRITNNVKANSGDYSTNAIYTLVFDNWTSANDQETVYFALELKNGDVDFYGQEGLIAAGQKFYLIGKLNPKSPATTSSITWPTYPDSYTGADKTLPKSYDGRYPVKANTNRVFIQDFTTLAQVNITSLKNAYVTIPDLRASKLQLGLSVDLTWQTGLTFDVNL